MRGGDRLGRGVVWAALAIVVLGALTVACDDGRSAAPVGGVVFPGAGGGVTNPAQPGAGGSDVTFPTTGDAATSDDAAAPVADAGPVSPDSECESGQLGCSGDNVLACNNGTWTLLASCPAGQTCEAGACVEGACQPTCGGAECGPDGCGGTCGTCGADETCEAGACAPGTCTPSCAGKQCGDDGCGASCGICGADESCVAGQCLSTCTPSCSGKQCGSDGCGGSCGTCGAGASCVNDQCLPTQTGTDTCGDVVDCVFNDCDPSDGVCQQSCFEAGTPAAQAAFQPFFECFAGCTTYACLADSCASFAVACLHPQDGLNSCVDLINCIGACPDDQTCVDACWDSATASAKTTYYEISWCLTDACPEDTLDLETCQQDALNFGACAGYASNCL